MSAPKARLKSNRQEPNRLKFNQLKPNPLKSNQLKLKSGLGVFLSGSIAR